MDAHSHQPVLFLYTPPTAFLANNAPRRKRFHRKTRNGCLTCRVRRVKCDEQKPACLRCLKLNQECRYDRTIELIRDLPASVSFLPRRQDIPNLEFFIINTADMLSPGEASAITMTGPVSPHDFRSNFSRLWKSLVVPLVYTEPLIMELVSQLAGRHRLALTTSHSGIKEHSLVVRTMAKIVETRPIDIVIVGAMILFAYECLHAVATLGSGETESRGQVHSSAFMRLLPVASRDLLRSVIPIVGVTWKMMEFCAKSNARSGQPVHVPDSFEDFEAADTCFTSIVWSSNLRVALAKWLKVTHQLHERIRGDDWHQSKMILTLLIEGQFLMTAYGMSLIPSDRNMDVLLQKIAGL